MTAALMFDLETLDIRASAAIASIGAVIFDPRSDWIGDTLHLHIDIAGQRAYRRTIGANTVLWWLGQDDTARQTLIAGQQDGPADLLVAIEAFAAFIPKDGEIWCNGNSFDLAILGDAYDHFNWNRPWQFHLERDLRTLKGLNKGLRIERNGTHHNALDDAIHQARLVQHILRLNQSASPGALIEAI